MNAAELKQQKVGENILDQSLETVGRCLQVQPRLRNSWPCVASMGLAFNLGTVLAVRGSG